MSDLGERQIEMARHALGLKDGRKRSYRNHYTVRLGTTDFQLWSAMVASGHAEGEARALWGHFCLTLKGARAVLLRGENLDPEDFPDEVDV